MFWKVIAGEGPVWPLTTQALRHATMRQLRKHLKMGRDNGSGQEDVGYPAFPPTSIPPGASLAPALALPGHLSESV